MCLAFLAARLKWCVDQDTKMVTFAQEIDLVAQRSVRVVVAAAPAPCTTLS